MSHSPALVWLALVHLLDLDDVGVAEVPLLADHVGLADARQEGDRLVVLGEGGRGVVQDRVVVVLLPVSGRESAIRKIISPLYFHIHALFLVWDTVIFLISNVPKMFTKF